MKTIRKTMYVSLIALALVFTGCSKDDDGGGGGNAAAGTIKAKVDGSTVTTLEMVTFAHLVSQGSNSILTMQGNTGGTEAKAFHFTIAGFEGEGTYGLGAGTAPVIASYVETIIDLNNPAEPEVKTWVSTSGEIKFSQSGDKVVGTFHFKAEAEDGSSIKNITDGAFNIEVDNL